MSEAKPFKLGTITDEKLAKSISHAIELYPLTPALEEEEEEAEDGKIVLHVRMH